MSAWSINPAHAAPGDILHIYIDGDGRPFHSRTEVARDPSPRRPYVLRLMQRDARPNLFLGRPCYHGLKDDEGCDARQWTTHRYSSAVVDSMVAAALRLSGARDVVLIGYSGGGTLAMLMAPRMNNIAGVITVAANLNVADWARLHGFSALSGSLDPTAALSATQDIPQMHYVGAVDEVVPPQLLDSISVLLPADSVRIIDGYDHTCCWPDHWPDLLSAALAPLEHTTRNVQTATPR